MAHDRALSAGRSRAVVPRRGAGARTGLRTVKPREITGALVGEAESLARFRPVGVSVLVASADPRVIAWAAPRVAHDLYPGRTFGRVLHHEPHPAPTWAHALRVEFWSEAIVEEL